MSLFVFTESLDLNMMLDEINKNRRVTDSGFDIPVVAQFADTYIRDHTFNLNIKVGATNSAGEPTPCLLLPRSSISNSPFRMANSIGLIDAGYRGIVKAKTDVIKPSEDSIFHIEGGTRYFQICRHDFLPWDHVHIVKHLSHLPKALDNRGEGGFGSTGN